MKTLARRGKVPRYPTTEWRIVLLYSGKFVIQSYDGTTLGGSREWETYEWTTGWGDSLTTISEYDTFDEAKRIVDAIREREWGDDKPIGEVVWP